MLVNVFHDALRTRLVVISNWFHVSPASDDPSYNVYRDKTTPRVQFVARTIGPSRSGCVENLQGPLRVLSAFTKFPGGWTFQCPWPTRLWRSHTYLHLFIWVLLIPILAFPSQVLKEVSSFHTPDASEAAADTPCTCVGWKWVCRAMPSISMFQGTSGTFAFGFYEMFLYKHPWTRPLRRVRTRT